MDDADKIAAEIVSHCDRHDLDRIELSLDIAAAIRQARRDAVRAVLNQDLSERYAGEASFDLSDELCDRILADAKQVQGRTE